MWCPLCTSAASGKNEAFPFEFWLIWLFFIADWHRCSSTHHWCPSVNNHAANDSTVWQNVPSWFLWYIWPSLILVLEESRWEIWLCCKYDSVAPFLWLLASTLSWETSGGLQFWLLGLVKWGKLDTKLKAISFLWQLMSGCCSCTMVLIGTTLWNEGFCDGLRSIVLFLPLHGRNATLRALRIWMDSRSSRWKGERKQLAWTRC